MEQQPEQIPYKSRKEWLKLRRSGIGGSDISVIMGVNPYRTIEQLVSDKLHGTESQETEPMQIGRDMENTIARMFKKRMPELHIYNPHVLWRKNEIFLASPDRFATTPQGQDLIIEIKNTAYFDKTRRSMAAYQIMWYMFVCNCRGGYIAALEAGTKLNIVPVVRDEAVIEKMVGLANSFWHNYITKQQEIIQ